MFKIMGRYEGGEEEEVDSAETKRDAEYLLSEYKLAFGAGWSLRIVRKRR